MTEIELFNIVAPIAIYHRADVMFLTKAQKAWTVAKRTDWGYGCEEPDTNLELDDTDTADWAEEIYGLLFMAVVWSVDPTAEVGHDYWGAKYVKVKGIDAFAGDAHDQFPWYETAELLLNRVTNPCFKKDRSG